MTVALILKQKNPEVTAVAPHHTIGEVAKVLSRHRIGAVLVQDTASQVLGILSERDIVHALARHGAPALEMSAAQLMTRDIRTASPATTVPEAMQMMTDGRFRHLPVLECGRLVGMISIGDVVKARLSQQAHEVDSLMAYVAGAA
jgi:CBS domain-containing protein